LHGAVRDQPLPQRSDVRQELHAAREPAVPGRTEDLHDVRSSVPDGGGTRDPAPDVAAGTAAIGRGEHRIRYGSRPRDAGREPSLGREPVTPRDRPGWRTYGRERIQVV